MLKQLVVQLLEELQKAKAALERQEHHMHLLLRRIYGSTSEKFDPQQALLFDPRPRRDEAAANAPAPPAATSRHDAAHCQTATGTAAAGFPRRSSVRKSFTI